MTAASGSAHYQLVAQQLRRRIADGTWAPGVALPTERSLTEEFGVSRATIRSALRQLRAEGVIVTVTGSGSRVRQPPAIRHLNADRYRSAIPQAGWTYQICAHQLTSADEQVAALLQISPGETVLTRCWHTQSPDGARAISYSYLRRSTAESIGAETVHGPQPGALIAALRGKGVDIDEITENVESRPPTVEEADVLEIHETRTWVLVLSRTMKSAGETVEVGIEVMPADHTKLTYRVIPNLY